MTQTLSNIKESDWATGNPEVRDLTAERHTGVIHQPNDRKCFYHPTGEPSMSNLLAETQQITMVYDDPFITHIIAGI